MCWALLNVLEIEIQEKIKIGRQKKQAWIGIQTYADWRELLRINDSRITSSDDYSTHLWSFYKQIYELTYWMIMKTSPIGALYFKTWETSIPLTILTYHSITHTSTPLWICRWFLMVLVTGSLWKQNWWCHHNANGKKKKGSHYLLYPRQVFMS